MPAAAARVRAVVLDGPAAGEVRARLAAQTHPLDGGHDADWTWLLDGAAAPHQDALARLLEAHDSWPGPAPALLAAKVVRPDGALEAEALPWPRLTRKEVAMQASEHRLVSLRVARHGALLVARTVIERFGLPDAVPGADLAWSARVLRDEVGLLVPAAVAVRTAPPAPVPLRARARALRGDAWDLEERMWVGVALAQEAVGALRPSRRPRSTTPTLSRASRLPRR